MATIEPGIYQIVNVGRGTAITVAAENTNTIVNWETHNGLNQQWLVRRATGGYHISDYVQARYMAADSTNWDANIHLGYHPTLWVLMPAKETTWRIKLAIVERDMFLDSDGGNNGDAIHLQPNVEHPDRLWRFERLGGLPSDVFESVHFGTTAKDQTIAQMVEQLSQKDKQLNELAGQLADQNRRIADQNQSIAGKTQKIADQERRIAEQTERISDQSQRIVDQNQKFVDQEREIYTQKRRIEEKDQQLAQANREVRYMLARVAQREEPPHQDLVDGASNLGVVERVQREVTLLQDKVKHLESLVNQLVDKDKMMPNNMS